MFGRLNVCCSAPLAVVTLLFGVSATCVAQAATPPVPASTAKYKGIFEPMNYPDDLNFSDVLFVNDQVGWIAGRGSGGMILHTVDGGRHWNLQLGDPKSSDPEIKDLHFLDATHGWARQAGNLLRTTDGTNWQVVGSYPGDFGVYVFISPTDGFEAFGPYSGSTIAATHDAGRSWKSLFQCTTSLQVDGLSRNVGCMINDLSFPSQRVGYGVGGSFNDGFAVIAKTEDSGATWRVIFATTELAPATGVVFQDENHGVVRLKGGGVIVSADGGHTWQGATGSPGNPKFADPRVGWSCYSYSCSVSLDGGMHWVSRSLQLPASIEAFSLPRRDRGYVVGQHGMIYHYRIVPAGYTATGILEVPLMPAYGEPIRDHLEKMSTQVVALRAKLRAVTAATSLQSCCATEIQDLGSSVDLLERQVPAFSGEYRNLNLMFVGMNMSADLAAAAQGINQSFAAVTQAPDVQSALVALQSLSAQISSATQSIDSGFENLSAGNVVSGSLLANSISNMASGGAARGPPDPNASAAQNGNATQPSVSPVGEVPQKAKEAFNKLLHF
jgi:Photosynthesis system II assembly factor YCF48